MWFDNFLKVLQDHTSMAADDGKFLDVHSRLGIAHLKTFPSGFNQVNTYQEFQSRVVTDVLLYSSIVYRNKDNGITASMKLSPGPHVDPGTTLGDVREWAYTTPVGLGTDAITYPQTYPDPWVCNECGSLINDGRLPVMVAERKVCHEDVVQQYVDPPPRFTLRYRFCSGVEAVAFATRRTLSLPRLLPDVRATLRMLGLCVDDGTGTVVPPTATMFVPDGTFVQGPHWCLLRQDVPYCVHWKTQQAPGGIPCRHCQYKFQRGHGSGKHWCSRQCRLGELYEFAAGRIPHHEAILDIKRDVEPHGDPTVDVYPAPPKHCMVAYGGVVFPGWAHAPCPTCSRGVRPSGKYAVTSVAIKEMTFQNTPVPILQEARQTSGKPSESKWAEGRAFADNNGNFEGLRAVNRNVQGPYTEMEKGSFYKAYCDQRDAGISHDDIVRQAIQRVPDTTYVNRVTNTTAARTAADNITRAETMPAVELGKGLLVPPRDGTSVGPSRVRLNNSTTTTAAPSTE